MRPGEIIVDSFAGGGGASTAIEEALGRPIDVAINHDPEAVAMHMANHPETLHYCKSVWSADPRAVAAGCPVGLAWFSPDCKHFSKAKGGTPVEKDIRDLAWVVVEWAKLVRPRVIMLENVEEFRDWGPLVMTEDGKTVPCPRRKGLEFRRWLRELVKHGYRVEHRELRACDYGSPTIRKRLFLVARRDGAPVVWAKPTHGPGLVPYRTAAECIDWSIPCRSIFERKKPLAENTLRRIARGIRRYVIDAAKAFIVPVTHTGDSRVHPIDEPFRTITRAPRGELAVVVPTIVGCGGRAGQSRPRGGDEPMATAKADACLVTANRMVNNSGHSGGAADAPAPTITTGNHHALVAATMVQTGYGERDGQAPRALDLEKPLGTVVAGGVKHGLVTAFLAQHNGGAVGHTAAEPLSTIMHQGSQQQLVTSHLLKLRNNQHSADLRAPMPTLTAGGGHVGEVRAFLIKYYGSGGQDQALSDPMHTLTAKARMGLVTIEGQDWQIVDIGMRMLTARELFRAQDFPDGYQIAPLYNGKPLSKTAQIRMCGNSVCRGPARALVAANLSQEAGQEWRRGAAE
ncbi:MAG: DNA cytosine methyltransferase [Dongiaceae bacterium]